MSHFACSEQDHPLNANQIQRFRDMRAFFPAFRARSRIRPAFSSAQAGASRSGAAGRRALRRQSDAGQTEPDAAGRRAAGRIVQMRDVAQGATVGYSATWTAQAPDAARHRRRSAMRTAICAPPARATRKPGAEAIVAGRRCPIAGPRFDGPDRVDVTDVPRRRGHSAAISSRCSATASGSTIWPTRAGTIGYEVLTSLGPALPADLSR